MNPAQKALWFIESHLADPLSLDDIAAIGGVASIPGSLAGGLFVLYVPNIAERVSTGLAGAIYGCIMLLVIFVMPSGAAGLARYAIARAAALRPPRQR